MLHEYFITVVIQSLGLELLFNIFLDRPVHVHINIVSPKKIDHQFYVMLQF